MFKRPSRNSNPDDEPPRPIYNNPFFNNNKQVYGSSVPYSQMHRAVGKSGSSSGGNSVWRNPLVIIAITLCICLTTLVVVPVTVWRQHKARLAKLDAPDAAIDQSSELYFYQPPELSLQCSKKLSRSMPDLYPGTSFQIESRKDVEAYRARLKKIQSSPAVTRLNLYRTMMAALGVDGLKLGGEVTQGLKQDDLFQFKEPRRAIFPEKATPILKPLNRPVRAVVMPLTDRNIAGRLMNAVRSKLRPLGNQAEATFFEQNLEMIHATVFHSSSHEDPWSPPTLAAQAEEIRAIETAIRSTGTVSNRGDMYAIYGNKTEPVEDMSRKGCPAFVMLERVFVTPGGVLVAAWQTVQGTEVSILRDRLREQFKSREKQKDSVRLVKQVVANNAMLHTTLGRFLKPPAELSKHYRAITLQEAQQVAKEVTEQLCGVAAEFNEAWLVKEDDLLALALGGKHEVVHKVKMKC